MSATTDAAIDDMNYMNKAKVLKCFKIDHDIHLMDEKTTNECWRGFIKKLIAREYISLKQYENYTKIQWVMK